ncbi:MAG TPA: archaeal heat shock protein Hsp20 [Candidatus Saccharimonadales bacterium]|nr:archaeal heat shock protein Hsp20 [Candidatus Saccharimonadales bacterium]
MNNKDIMPNDWINILFDLPFGKRSRRLSYVLNSKDMLSEFDTMHDEMNRLFDAFNNLSNNTPNELVKESKTKESNKVREIGPVVYGYSITIGPEGKLHVREFGNVKSLKNSDAQNTRSQSRQMPQISADREPLVDVNTTDKEVKVVVEMPGISKTDIKIKAYDSKAEVTTAKDAQRKYHKIIDLPEQADLETARSVYNNGILEITFDKKIVNKPAGTEIKIEWNRSNLPTYLLSSCF